MTGQPSTGQIRLRLLGALAALGCGVAAVVVGIVLLQSALR
jgi:hypothetical protein